MTPDPERDRLAAAKRDAFRIAEAVRNTEAGMAAWDAYLDAWLALHEYDRARWNATHPDTPIQPHTPTGDTA